MSAARAARGVSFGVPADLKRSPDEGCPQEAMSGRVFAKMYARDVIPQMRVHEARSRR